jgi:competence protein ComEC
VSDAAAVALAMAVVAGAWWAAPVPRWLAVLVVVMAFAARRAWLLVGGAGLLASSLAVAAWAGLHPPPAASVDSIEGVGVLVGDPAERFGAVQVDVRLGGRRVEAWARGEAARQLRPRLAGEQVRLRGRLRAPSAGARRWFATRHLAARMEVDHVGGWAEASPAFRAANAVRRRLDRGARPLEDDQRSLLLGVVLGDDRDQSDALTAAFRASGLSHLLAVSGQNVAYTLALAGPLLRPLGLRSRLVATFAILVFFALLTRWEPSVLRAGAMAALACTAATMGRPSTRIRLLALAVAAVVLIDPLLVHAVGFQLSVGATLGITLLTGPLLARLRGPRWLAEALAVTIAAQVGVAPVALPAFGAIPLASLPANVLAVPVAAPLTAWGLTGGLLAGLVGAPFDEVLHLPTRVLTWWLAGVARWGAGLPLGAVRTSHALVLAGVVLAAAVGRAKMRATWRRSTSWPWGRTGSTSPPGPS